MTAINFTVDDDRLFIVTDSLLSTACPELTGHTSKAVFIPHLNLVMAAMGSGAVIRTWLMDLYRFFDRLDVAAVDRITTESLKRHWQCDGRGVHTRVFHFGIERVTGEIAAFHYCSKYDFVSQRFPRGGHTYTVPHIAKPDQKVESAAPPELEPAPTAPVETSGEPPVIPVSPDMRTWHRRVQHCIATLAEQHRQHPLSIAGSAMCTMLTATELKQWNAGDISTGMPE